MTINDKPVNLQITAFPYNLATFFQSFVACFGTYLCCAAQWLYTFSSFLVWKYLRGKCLSAWIFKPIVEIQCVCWVSRVPTLTLLYIWAIGEHAYMVYCCMYMIGSNCCSFNMPGTLVFAFCLHIFFESVRMTVKLRMPEQPGSTETHLFLWFLASCDN